MSAISSFISNSLNSRIFSSCCFSKSQKKLENEVKDLLSQIELFSVVKEGGPLQDRDVVIGAADRILASNLDKKSVSPLIRSLEKAVLVIRRKFTTEPEKTKALEAAIKRHDQKNYERWTKKYGLPESTFFDHPKFVDFIFSSHLHKSFEYFGHKLQFQEEKVGLQVEGRFMEACEIMQRFIIKDGKIFSREDGELRRWIYMEAGLICHDPFNWDHPIPLRRLKEKPEGFFLQVVTSYVKDENQVFLDNVLKGARHTWFRLISPEGEVYSFGWGHDPRDFNVLQPLSSIKAKVSCPDGFETYAEQRLETTIPITEAQAEAVVEIIQKAKDDERVQFNYINGNCAAFTEQVLSAAGIKQIPNTQITISQALYKLLVPKVVRNVLKFLWKWSLGLVAPDFVKKTVAWTVNFFTTLLILPAGTLLGGWFRVGNKERAASSPLRSSESAKELKGPLTQTVSSVKRYFIEYAKQHKWDKQANQALRPLVGRVYNHISDIINPHTLTMTSPSLIARWQKKQGFQTMMCGS